MTPATKIRPDLQPPRLSRQQRKRIESRSRRFGPDRGAIEVLKICLAEYRSRHPEDPRSDVEVVNDFRMPRPDLVGPDRGPAGDADSPAMTPDIRPGATAVTD